MRLYYSPGAGSMAVHIILRESGLPFDLEKVNLHKQQTVSGEDYSQINPKSYVPALELDDGQLLTEAAVILQYIADQKPKANLAPRSGTMERYRLMEWLNFLATEVHKQFSPLFNPKITPEAKQAQIRYLGRRFDYLAEHLTDSPYVLNGRFTVGDAYLFTLLNWTALLGVDLGKWPALRDYMARIGERPAVREAMKAEGLV